MQIKRIVEAACWMLTLGLTACSTIYVANVPFTTVEICSEELASRLHPYSGCIPATRAKDAEGAFVGRYRLPISELEWNGVISAVAATSGVSKTNLLPSWIGRAIPRQDLEKTGPMFFPMPKHNSINVLGGASIVKATEKIPTEVFFHTDLSGIIHKKIKAETEFNAATIAKNALQFAGIPATPSLQGMLAEKVLAVGYMSDSISAGSGGYYYVSMNTEQLDGLTTALSICNKPKNKSKKCSEMLKNEPVDDNVKALITEAEKVAEKVGVTNVGIVIGVSILHTQGASEFCSQKDIGLLSKEGSNEPLSLNCTMLHNALNTPDLTAAVSAAAVNAYASGVPDTAKKHLKNNLLISIQAAYSKTTVKKLGVYPHTSVLALHWLPLAVSGVPSTE